MAVSFNLAIFGKNGEDFKEKNYVSIGTIIYIYGYQGEGNGTPLQYCCPENPMDGGAW